MTFFVVCVVGFVSGSLIPYTGLFYCLLLLGSGVGEESRFV